MTSARSQDKVNMKKFKYIFAHQQQIIRYSDFLKFYFNLTIKYLWTNLAKYVIRPTVKTTNSLPREFMNKWNK